jgi:hypothetical protein
MKMTTHDVTGVIAWDTARLWSRDLIIGRAISSKRPVDIFSDFCRLFEELGLVKEFLDGLEDVSGEFGLSAIKSFICLRVIGSFSE